MTTYIQMIPVDMIDAHPHNPRRDLGNLVELTASIAAQGIRQNLLVVEWCPACPESERALITRGDRRICSIHVRAARFKLVIGHRRCAAAKLAGLTTVPAVIDQQLDAAGQLELMLLENIQRSDLSPVEEAQGYQDLLDLGVKVRAIAKTTGRAEKTVTARLRLLKLPADAQTMVHAGQATLEDAAQLDRFLDGTTKTDPARLKRLVASLGTQNFKWEIRSAHSDAETRECAAKLRARLDELGITILDQQPERWSTTSTWAWDAWADTVDDLTPEAFDGGKVAYLSTRGSVSIWRPKTDDETTADSTESSAREQREKFDKELRVEARLAYELRDAFVREYVERKKLPAAHQLAIVDTVAPLLLAGFPRVTDTREWLQLPSANRHSSPTQNLAELTESHASVPAASQLLIWLHTTYYTRNWIGAWQEPNAVALYALLEKLGYTVSDAERARITNPDAATSAP